MSARVRPQARLVRLLSAFVGTMAVGSALVDAQERRAEAPFQVEAALVPALRSASAEGPTALLLIDLNSAEDGTEPAIREPGGEMTIIYENGLARGHIQEIRKSCVYLCGFDGGATCHYQALVAPDAKAGALGAALAAFVGEPQITAFEPLRPQAAGEVEWLSGFAAPVWPQDYSAGIRIDEWDAAARRVRLSVRAADEDITVEDRECEAIGAAGLVALTCPSIAILAEAGVPLLVSWPEYESAAAAPVARFRLNGREAVLVRFGMSAETIHGVLLRDGARWVPLFRSADYPTMC
jgi:hypothetical protein